MSSGKNICVECGLCCDGTLFDYAFLEKDEEVNPAYAFKVTIESGNARTFGLPCCYLQGAVCSIYDHRPYSVCEKYKCNNLKKYISGAVSFDQAIARIKTVQDLRESILNRLAIDFPGLEGETILRKLENLEKLSELNVFTAELRKKHSELFLEIGKFTLLVGMYFVEKNTKSEHQC